MQRPTIGLFAQPGRLIHREPERQRTLLDGRGNQSLAATGRAVRLAQHQRNLMPCVDHGIEHRDREFRRAGEDQPQRSLSDWGVRALGGVALLLDELGTDAGLFEA